MLRALAWLGWTDLRDKQVLDLWCGDGYWLREFLKWGLRPGRAFAWILLRVAWLSPGSSAPPQ